MNDNDIEKKLKDLDDQKVPYPRDLKTATRAEYTTRVKMMKSKRPGCPLFGGIIILLITIIAQVI